MKLCQAWHIPFTSDEMAFCNSIISFEINKFWRFLVIRKRGSSNMVTSSFWTKPQEQQPRTIFKSSKQQRILPLCARWHMPSHLIYPSPTICCYGYPQLMGEGGGGEGLELLLPSRQWRDLGWKGSGSTGGKQDPPSCLILSAVPCQLGSRLKYRKPIHYHCSCPCAAQLEWGRNVYGASPTHGAARRKALVGKGKAE